VAKTTARKTARKTSAAKRTLLKNRAGTFYATRKKSGQFAELDERGRALSADRRRRAKKTTTSGYGDQGDRARKKR
jgi:hypothetical protein